MHTQSDQIFTLTEDEHKDAILYWLEAKGEDVRTAKHEHVQLEQLGDNRLHARIHRNDTDRVSQRVRGR
jgi:hypothetical protein